MKHIYYDRHRITEATVKLVVVQQVNKYYLLFVPGGRKRVKGDSNMNHFHYFHHFS